MAQGFLLGALPSGGSRRASCRNRAKSSEEPYAVSWRAIELVKPAE